MDTVLVPLTQGKVAIVDAGDAERVLAFKWHAIQTNYTCYAATNINGSRVYMHRFLMNASSDEQVDHVNHNGLDNRRSENIRIATNAQNNQNKQKHPNNTSGYKGVYWSKVRSRWMAYISKDGTRYNLGYYDSLEDAARVYDMKARELHGEFARLNFPAENATIEISTKKVRRDTKSGYRGVFWNTGRACWTACITKDGKRHHLGQHKTAEDAARAYNVAAREIFGKEAAINVVPS